MKFTFGFLTGVVFVLVAFVTFIGGIFLAAKALEESSDETSDPTTPAATYHGMTPEREVSTP